MNVAIEPSIDTEPLDGLSLIENVKLSPSTSSPLSEISIGFPSLIVIH